MDNILLVNQQKGQCGVYQFLRNIYELTASVSGRYKLDYVECANQGDFLIAFGRRPYEFVIFNHHQLAMPWVTPALARLKPSCVFMHDTRWQPEGVGVIHANPAFIESGFDFKLIRPLPKMNVPRPEPRKLAIGTFGFGFEHKGFYEIIERALTEFPTEQPMVRIRLPFNTQVDASGGHARHVAQRCREIANGKKILLEIYHEYLTKDELLYWLAENTINCFFYRGKPSNGYSSTVDWAVASQRPLAITDNDMFRHILHYAPETNADKYSLKEIIEKGTKPLEYFYKNWTDAAMYENICSIADKMRGMQCV